MLKKVFRVGKFLGNIYLLTLCDRQTSEREAFIEEKCSFFNIVQTGGRGGASCFRIGGAEDNFIFYIDEIKVKVQYFKAISIHFMSNFSLRAHFPPKNIVIWWKINIFDTKKQVLRYSTTFQHPNHLDQQKMNKIQLYS